MKTTCPHCKAVVESQDLQVLTRHVATCGKRPKKPKAPRIALRKDIEPPQAPVTLMFRKRILSHNFMKSKHWRLYARHVKEWYEHLEPYVMDWKGLGLSWSSWEITRVIRPPYRMFDTANLVGGTKPIPDGLQRHGVICDDSPKHFHCEYYQLGPEEAQVPDGVETILRLVEYRL